MMATLDALVAHAGHHGRPARAVVWAHNSHVGDARATSMARLGEINLGQLTRERYGHACCLIGMTTDHGSVTAARAWDGAAEHRKVRPSCHGSYERLFHDAALPMFFLRLAAADLAALKRPRLERAIGVIYRPETERASHYLVASLPAQFDLIVHVDRTRALEPLETWARHEIDFRRPIRLESEMKFHMTLLGVVLALAVPAPAAFAQPESRTAVSFSAGAASGTSDTGVALGGSVLFDLTERVSIEGQGTYLDRGAGAGAFSVGGSVLVNLLRSNKSVVPYAAMGGGMDHASYDLANPRLLGAAGMQFAAGSSLCPAPGTGFGFGRGPGWGSDAGTCPATVAGYWGVGELPAFYARRMGLMVFSPGGAWERRSFTDPALSVGGGVRVNVSERLMLRPDLRALVVFAGGETHTLGVFVMNLGYRF